MGSSLTHRGSLGTATPKEAIPKSSKPVSHKKWKNPLAYAEMLEPTKLGHFYKCMDQDCVFTHHDKLKFMKHLKDHIRLDEFRKVEHTWNLCAYCSKVIPDIPGYMAHLQKDHKDCKIQCPYCFRRFVSHQDAVVHQEEEHKKLKIKQRHVLECMGKSEPKVVILIENP